MHEESTSDTQARRSPGWSVIVLWAFGLFAVYVLSTGPIVKLSRSGHISQNSLETLYAPLIWASDHNRGVEKFLEWYVRKVWKVQ